MTFSIQLHRAQSQETQATSLHWNASLAGESLVVGSVGGSLGPRTDSAMLTISSLVVNDLHRRRGVATAMLRQYVDRVIESRPDIQTIRAVASTQLANLFLRCGFRVTRVVKTDEALFEYVLDAGRRAPVVQVDAFTSEIFSGNPAAVVLLPRSLYTHASATEWMQNVAKEKNLAQTAFATRREPLDGSAGVDYDLRWFSPVVEVPLCGHATLSTAFVLYEDGHVPDDSTIHFHTKSGVLVCNRDATKWISMDFPLRALEAVTSDFPRALLATALGIAETDFIAVQQTQTSYVLVHIPTDKFAAIAPNFDLLLRIDAIGFIVTAQAPAGEVDFQSRFFAPRIGVPEDPVTGSAHCVLAGYWSTVLNKSSLFAHQPCPVRGGFMRLEVSEDRPGRVIIQGEAVISCRGALAPFTS